MSEKPFAVGLPAEETWTFLAVDENGKKLEDVPENYITVFNETMTEDQATRLEALLTEIGFTAFKTEM